jgi:hypothetical protein
MPAEQQDLTARSTSVALRALNRFASSGVIDRLGLRDPAERFLHGASKTTMRTAATAGRTFAAAQKLTRPARQPRVEGSGLFDLATSSKCCATRSVSSRSRSFARSHWRPTMHVRRPRNC